ncbi:hypothetical protein DXG03_004115, partial [Asterophora parasitica]
ELKERLQAFCDANHFEYQSVYTPSGSARPRVNFHFIRHDIVDQIQENKPVFDGRVYTPHTPAYIQPRYGLEIGIKNVGGFPPAKFLLDTYIRRKYGNDSLLTSRIELDGSIYCACLRDPITTTRLLVEPFTPLEETPLAETTSFRPFKPDYVFNLNDNGFVGFRAHIQMLAESRQQHETLASEIRTNERAFEQLAADATRIAEGLVQTQQQVLAETENFFNFWSILLRLVMAKGELHSIRSRIYSINMILALGQTTPAAVERLTDSVADLERELADARHEVAQLEADYAASAALSQSAPVPPAANLSSTMPPT